MTPFENTVVVAQGLAVICLVLAIARWEKGRWIGFLMAAVCVVFLIGFLGFAVGRGGPKSAMTETDRPPEVQVLWMRPVRSVGIYAVLTWPGLKEPRFYWFPWDAKKGEAAQAALLEAAARRTGLALRNPFGGDSHGSDAGESSSDNTGDNAGVLGAFDFPARTSPEKP